MVAGIPGSLELRAIRSQDLPVSLVWRRIAGSPTIQPSSPAKLIEVKRYLSLSSSNLRFSQVLPPSLVSKMAASLPTTQPCWGLPVNVRSWILDSVGSWMDLQGLVANG